MTKKRHVTAYCEECEDFKSTLEYGKCPKHPQQKMNLIEESSWFFALSKFKQRLLFSIRQREFEILPHAKCYEMINLIESGLKDIPISRPNLSWGVPLSFDENQVTSVWFDVLVNYLVGAGYPGDSYQYCWPANMLFVNKDIAEMHCTLFPAIFMACDMALPRQIFVCGSLRSKEFHINPLDMVDTYGSDACRYYFMSKYLFDEDGEYCFDTFANIYNKNLANNLGNLMGRIVTLVTNH